MTDNISEKDKKDWKNFLSKNEKLPNKDLNLSKKKNEKVRSLDLHGYSLEEANNKIEDFIKQSYLEEVSKLVIITGKGLHSQNESDPYVSKDMGILKNSIPYFIKNNFELMKLIREFDEASIEDGGGGAFYIYIKKKV